MTLQVSNRGISFAVRSDKRAEWSWEGNWDQREAGWAWKWEVDDHVRIRSLTNFFLINFTKTFSASFFSPSLSLSWTFTRGTLKNFLFILKTFFYHWSNGLKKNYHEWNVKMFSCVRQKQQRLSSTTTKDSEAIFKNK